MNAKEMLEAMKMLSGFTKAQAQPQISIEEITRIVEAAVDKALRARLPELREYTDSRIDSVRQTVQELYGQRSEGEERLKWLRSKYSSGNGNRCGMG